jgi:hypothetical protein
MIACVNTRREERGERREERGERCVIFEISKNELTFLEATNNFE